LRVIAGYLKCEAGLVRVEKKLRVYKKGKERLRKKEGAGESGWYEQRLAWPGENDGGKGER
jgi:hypothetical protein